MGASAMKGLVVKSTGSWYTVMDEGGKTHACRLRGRFKKEGLQSTNPIAVGDRVRFKPLPGETSGLILEIADRKNHLIRKATKLSRRTHAMAANIDQAMVIATLAEPRTSTGFIDRVLVTCEAYSIPAVIIFNKMDLIREEAQKRSLDELTETYSSLGYPCLHVSALNKTGLQEFQDRMKGRINLLAGHSGVGKSALINAIDPSVQLKVQPISNAHKKGKHTTTFAEMIPLKMGGFIIDTPGIKEFGLVDFDPEELSHFFPEMRALFNRCRFDNCTHLNEPGCVVKNEVDKGGISQSRYENYINMLMGRETRG